MAVYSIYQRGDRTVFLRDIFSWATFFLALVLLTAAANTAGQTLLAFVASLLLGFIGDDLQRWVLEQRGFAEVDLIAAGSREEAELKFYAARQRHRQPADSPDTLGLFGTS